MFASPGSATFERYNIRKFEIGISFTVFLFSVLMLIKDGKNLSTSLSKNKNIAGVTKSPYFQDSLIDLDDGQLSAFLEGLPLMTFVASVFVIGRKIVLRYKNTVSTSLKYYIIFGLLHAGYIHGPAVILLIVWVILSYLIIKRFAGKKGFFIIFWIGSLGCMILTKYFRNFEFHLIWDELDFLDYYDCVLRWYTVTNFFLLKILSFGIDYHWMVQNKPNPTQGKHLSTCSECTLSANCLKYRSESHADLYSLPSFISYCFYPPLYLAGPTITYNAWISQVKSAQKSYTTKNLLVYTLRFFLVFLILIWFIHNLYLPTIAHNKKNREILENFSPYEIIVTSFCVLKWIWLKFTVIWRFFRIWALLDGIESPENMNRCMSNNYCFEGFWRSWHRAFNQWLVRYLFIPLGGSKYKIFNIWAVFGFVAVWHDLSSNLLAWGWGMCIFIMPEILVKAYFKRDEMAEFRKSLVYSWMCAGTGALYVGFLVIANMVGFSFGVSGLFVVLEGICNYEGAFLIAKCWFLITFGVHFMFLFREFEESSGKKNKGF